MAALYDAVSALSRKKSQGVVFKHPLSRSRNNIGDVGGATVNMCQKGVPINCLALSLGTFFSKWFSDSMFANISTTFLYIPI